MTPSDSKVENLPKQVGNKLVVLSPTEQGLTNRVCNALRTGELFTLHIKGLLRICRTTAAKNLLLIRCLSSISRRRVAANGIIDAPPPTATIPDAFKNYDGLVSSPAC